MALHCTLGRGKAWAGIAEALGEGYSLVAPDLPGHGRAPDWDGPAGSYTPTAIETAAPLLSRRMHLIGHSYGAYLALRLAALFPERVASLSLFEPIYFSTVVGSPEELADRAAIAAVKAAFDSGDRVTAAERFNEIWGDGPWANVPGPRRAQFAERIHIVLDHERLRLGDGSWLPEGGLADLRMPTLLIRGAKSPPITGVVQDSLQQLLPNAKGRVVDDAGHMGPLTHPAEVGALIRAHLDANA